MSKLVPRFKRDSTALFLLLLAAASGCASDPAPGTAGRSAGRVPVPAGAAGAAPLAGSRGTAGAPSGAPDPASSGTGAGGGAGIGSIAGSGAAGAGARSGSVRERGALRVAGNRIVDSAGRPVQLRGMSLFWSQWSSYYLASTIDQLADDWRATVVRAALGVENGGYLQDPAANEAKVVTVVDRAIARDLYVIIDWHDHHAHEHQAAAIDFFTRMAKKYGAAPNVIFEIYNEPQMVGWPVVKGYAEAVLAAIRGAGSNNLVIVGTPNWSQDVDIAAANPIRAYPNVAYTLHFYAMTHKQFLRDKAQRALDAGAALFVTEWGTCDSSGDGSVDEAETRTWLEFLRQHQISWVNWALNDKAEACSALTPNAGTNGPWSGGALTLSGALVKPMIP